MSRIGWMFLLEAERFVSIFDIYHRYTQQYQGKAVGFDEELPIRGDIALGRDRQ